MWKIFVALDRYILRLLLWWNSLNHLRHFTRTMCNTCEFEWRRNKKKTKKKISTQHVSSLTNRNWASCCCTDFDRPLCFFVRKHPNDAVQNATYKMKLKRNKLVLPCGKSWCNDNKLDQMPSDDIRSRALTSRLWFLHELSPILSLRVRSCIALHETCCARCNARNSRPATDGRTVSFATSALNAREERKKKKSGDWYFEFSNCSYRSTRKMQRGRSQTSQSYTLENDKNCKTFYSQVGETCSQLEQSPIWQSL